MIHSEELELKKRNLMRQLEKCDSLLVAYSGGVDSTFLLAVAHEVMGNSVIAATADSSTFPTKELHEAKQFTEKRGIEHIVFQVDELSVAEFVSNSPDRCYHCKKTLSKALLKIAHSREIASIAYGANFDDTSDYRPGMVAAAEMGLLAPLVDAGLTKKEIRILSQEMELPTWDKPAMACLASRIPFGSPITIRKLKMIADGEKLLSNLGFRQYRVRHHGSIARIEVEDNEIDKICDKRLRQSITRHFRELGFKYVSIDLEGYVSGSMNRQIENQPT